MARNRHESSELGAMVVRMMRALVTRAAEGDTEAIEQLASIEQLAPSATSLAAGLAHERMGYSYADLAGELGISRQAVAQRVRRTRLQLALNHTTHVLVPGHNKRSCPECAIVEASTRLDGREVHQIEAAL